MIAVTQLARCHRDSGSGGGPAGRHCGTLRLALTVTLRVRLRLPGPPARGNFKLITT